MSPNEWCGWCRIRLFSRTTDFRQQMKQASLEKGELSISHCDHNSWAQHPVTLLPQAPRQAQLVENWHAGIVQAELNGSHLLRMLAVLPAWMLTSLVISTLGQCSSVNTKQTLTEAVAKNKLHSKPFVWCVNCLCLCIMNQTSTIKSHSRKNYRPMHREVAIRHKA